MAGFRTQHNCSLDSINVCTEFTIRNMTNICKYTNSQWKDEQYVYTNSQWKYEQGGIFDN